MLRFVLLVALALAAPAPGQSADGVVKVAAPAVADAGPRPDLAAVAKSVFEETNAFRKSQGRAAVKLDKSLAGAAQSFGEFMAKSDEFGHTADGKRPAERAEDRGYDYCVVLENIAHAFDPQGFPDAKLSEKFMTGWEASPGHRRNLLDADATELGVGVARSDATGHYYAVQLFGRPKSAAIRFEVTNDAGEEVAYTLGETPFKLAARATQTHTLCRPAAVTFRWPGGDVAVTPTTGASLLVTKAGDKFAVTGGDRAPSPRTP